MTHFLVLTLDDYGRWSCSRAASAEIVVVARPDQSNVAVVLLIISGAECGN